MFSHIYFVIVQVEKYCVWGQTLGKTPKVLVSADNVDFESDVFHVKVHGGVSYLQFSSLHKDKYFLGIITSQSHSSGHAVTVF